MFSIRNIFIFLLFVVMEGVAIEPQKIVIFGAGYVGLVTGSCLTKYGHHITFVETNSEKVAHLQNKKMPIFEPQLEELFCQGLEKGLIEVRCAPGVEICEADMAIIAVATPTNEAGEPQLQAVEQVLTQIASAMEKRKKNLIVSIRSTLLPNAFRRLQSACEAQSPQIALVMNPEFLRESTAVKDFCHPPFCIAGGDDPDAVKRVLDLYEEISPKRFELSGESACLLKYACNAFHATKIAFANEISSICESLEIDPVEVMDIFSQDTHLNLSAAYLRPGFAFGGSCLIKDLRALLSLEEQTPLLSAILPSNQCRFHKTLQAILKGNHKQLAILGMSFKKNSDDVRDSPYVELIEMLHQEGLSLKIYDADIDREKLKRSHQRIHPFLPFLEEDLAVALEGCDGIVLCKDYLDAPVLQEILSTGIVVYDLGYYQEKK